MEVIADLQLHSRFSRAVSSQMVVPTICAWAKKKGIGLVATGDWTHPLWLRELQANLEEAGEGVYELKSKIKNQKSKPGKRGPFFLLSTEVSSIYSQGGKTRRVHTLIFAPNFAAVEKINKEFLSRGCNLLSDGRPIVGLSAKAVAEIALNVDSRCLIIPAHAWTPWFSLYGSMGGFDSIEECFGDYSKYIYAIETGLSSDPALNWRIAELDERNIVSFSDAHSPAKLGREATVFKIKNLKLKNQNDKSKIQINYKDISDAIRSNPEGDWEIGYTIEFYPEEGKYHYTGHRNCKVVHSPRETRKLGTTCPVCGKRLTVGVLARVEHLAKSDVEIKTETDKFGVRWIKDREGARKPYVMLVPLLEILSESLSSGVSSQKVVSVYDNLTGLFGGEFNVLLKTELGEIERVAGARVSQGIAKVRSGDIVIEPGFDGVFGKVKIWKEEDDLEKVLTVDQGSLF